MSQKYEWYEDMKSIRIKIPIKGVSMKKIDIYMSDLVLKVNVAEIKMVKLLDLKEKIDFESTENHVIYKN
jgi:dyslexia susceptibility 1 candidate gene 1 protein